MIVATAPWRRTSLGKQHLYLTRGAPWIMLALTAVATEMKWA